MYIHIHIYRNNYVTLPFVSDDSSYIQFYINWSCLLKRPLKWTIVQDCGCLPGSKMRKRSLRVIGGVVSQRPHAQQLHYKDKKSGKGTYVRAWLRTQDHTRSQGTYSKSTERGSSGSTAQVSDSASFPATCPITSGFCVKYLPSYLWPS